MSRRDDRRARRRLALKRETIRALSATDLGRAAGGTWGGTWDCDNVETEACDTTECWYSAGSRYC